MPRFFAKRTFELPEQKFFVMAGSVIEGEVTAGMFLNIPFNSSFRMTAQIQRVEFARRDGHEDVCLFFESEPEMADIWRGLDIGEEAFEVTTEGNI